MEYLERTLLTPANEMMTWATVKQVAQGLKFMQDRG
jgi:hypothetical protein